MPIALTIAGSDSSGGAGIQADLKTFAAHGIYGTCALTAATAQNTVGVTGVFPMPADFVSAQIEAIAGDMPIDVVKTGMLATSAIIDAVAAAIESLELPSVIVDPVITSSTGQPLCDKEAVATLLSELLPRARVVTPNIPEAEQLLALLGGGTGTGTKIDTLDAARTAVRRLHKQLGAGAIVLKGGHLPANGSDNDEAIDLLFDGHTLHEFRGPRLSATTTHGTGCTFASAIAANLALGHPLPESVRLAKAYVTGAIRHGLPIGNGPGPLNHFWQTAAAAVKGQPLAL
jgi:hydroxymethylpyrimidine/phosphomethylpyrimidine kinase